MNEVVEQFYLLREIGVGAVEIGSISFEDSRKKMEQENRFKASELDSFFEVLKGRGINNMKELAIASDRILGGIIADLMCVFSEMETTE